jgi:hypothetical protein
MVSVFYCKGCPRPGYYELSCSIPCPYINCRYCHIDTGACLGCKPGYQGHQCEKGMYFFYAYIIACRILCKLSTFVSGCPINFYNPFILVNNLRILSDTSIDKYRVHPSDMFGMFRIICFIKTDMDLVYHISWIHHWNFYNISFDWLFTVLRPASREDPG